MLHKPEDLSSGLNGHVANSRQGFTHYGYLGAVRTKSRGSLGLAGYQHSFSFSERPCLREIKNYRGHQIFPSSFYKCLNIYTHVCTSHTHTHRPVCSVFEEGCEERTWLSGLLSRGPITVSSVGKPATRSSGQYIRISSCPSQGNQVRHQSTFHGAAFQGGGGV